MSRVPTTGEHPDPVSPYFSQHGEDAALARFFDGKSAGYYVEVGALDGIEISNTAYFEKTLGWTGVLVEANPTSAAACRRNRPNSTVAAVAVVEPGTAGSPVDFEVVDGFDALSSRRLTWWGQRTMRTITEAHVADLEVRRIQVPSATLDQVLTDAGVPREFDFMTIDVEGHELAALRGMSLGSCWTPRVLLIENGSGVVGLRLAAYLFRRGYGYRRSIAINDWYEPTPTAGRTLGVIRCEAHGLGSFLRYQAIALRGRVPILLRLQRWVERRLLHRRR